VLPEGAERLRDGAERGGRHDLPLRERQPAPGAQPGLGVTHGWGAPMGAEVHVMFLLENVNGLVGLSQVWGAPMGAEVDMMFFFENVKGLVGLSQVWGGTHGWGAPMGAEVHVMFLLENVNGLVGRS